MPETKKRRTKSGCRTCRIRKVKCDEAFPACHRCIDTGRKCDGYGIRGGGHSGVAVTSRARLRAMVTAAAPVAAPCNSIGLLVTTPEERDMMEWFQCRTAVKLQGSFYSDFWTSLLMQSSVAEPAVLHAVLALGSIHRQGIMSQNSPDVGRPGYACETALRHYGKAIDHLQPHFLAGDRLAHRVALITCIIFTSMEFLRGHFKTAFIHLQNGLKLLSNTQSWAMTRFTAASTAGAGCDYIDEWIEEIFSRIYLQIGLIRFLHRGAFLEPLHECMASSIQVPADGFSSIKSAWVALERLILNAMALSGRARSGGGQPENMLQEQSNLLQKVNDWEEAYETSRPKLLGQRSVNERKADGILIAYHAMASIMAAVCLSPCDEMIFDQHTDQFARLTSHMIGVAAISPRDSSTRMPPSKMSFDMALSIVDMGCIVPLYYTALKCRVPGLRLRAVAFLESTFHREGVWDSTMTSRIARKIMELEGGMLVNDENGGVANHGTQDLVPCVPAHSRLHEVEVRLVGEPVARMALFCSSQGFKSGVRSCIGEYDMFSETWTDAVGLHGGQLE